MIYSLAERRYLLARICEYLAGEHLMEAATLLDRRHCVLALMSNLLIYSGQRFRMPPFTSIVVPVM